MSKLKHLFLLVILLASATCTYATHIRAADLFAQINPYGLSDPDAHLQVKFTLNVYCNKATVGNSYNPKAQNNCDIQLANCATLDFGDGSTSQVTYKTVTDMGNNTLFYVYEFFHTFPADKIEPGYIIGYRDENRNGGIINLGGGSSYLIPLYISMELGLESGLGKNQTPQLSIPPLDHGEVGKIFIHNPGAYDVDGDSISYTAFVPQSSKGVTVNPYYDPTNYPAPNTPNSFSVNSKTGDVVWNAPGQVGLFNIAFKIEEWRTFGKSRILISYAIRDMQIEIDPGTNSPPVLKVPSNVCIVPNQRYSSVVSVTDPDFNSVSLTGYGELFANPLDTTQKANSASLSIKPTPYQYATPLRATFSWTPGCTDIRKRPYFAYFNATDAPTDGSPALTDIKSFSITVVAPSPTGLKASVDSNSKIHVNWDMYSCPSKNPKQLLLYRRSGCGNVSVPNCLTGAPNSDYVLIKTLGITTTTFVDSTAKRGNLYSYALVAQFQDGVGLTCYSIPALTPSDSCVQLPLIAPIITNVSFVGPKKDRILVKWQKPVDLDTSKVQGPYQYSLYKKKVGTTGGYQLLVRYDTTSTPVDSSYLDTAILASTDYVYYVKFSYFTSGHVSTFLADSSEISTNVSLYLTPIRKGIQLNWQATTPWYNNIDSLYHHVWRKRTVDSTYLLIDSVKFNQSIQLFTYDDVGKFHNQPLKLRDTVSYFVTTAGSYQNFRITSKELLNNSFIAKGVMLDTDPPCAPTLNDLSYDCNSFSEVYPFKNVLHWQPQPYSDQCDSDIVRYNIYYSVNNDSQNYSLVGSLYGDSSTTFIHSNLASLAGCYTVTALDAAKNESNKSNKVCVSNCNLYTLPNVFTPNGSGVNDFFRPIPPSPRFVESVKFTVFNRWGGKVFERNDDIMLNWDGSGLPDGIYFYTAKVQYISPDGSSSPEELKGWIQIIR